MCYACFSFFPSFFVDAVAFGCGRGCSCGCHFFCRCVVVAAVVTLLLVLLLLQLALRSVSISFLHFAAGQWQQNAVDNSNSNKKRKLIGEKINRN